MLLITNIGIPTPATAVGTGSIFRTWYTLSTAVIVSSDIWRVSEVVLIVWSDWFIILTNLFLVFIISTSGSGRESEIGHVMRAFNSSVISPLFSSINSWILERPYWAKRVKIKGITDFFKLSTTLFNFFSAVNSKVVYLVVYSSTSLSLRANNLFISFWRLDILGDNLIIPKSSLTSPVEEYGTILITEYWGFKVVIGNNVGFNPVYISPSVSINEGTLRLNSPFLLVLFIFFKGPVTITPFKGSLVVWSTIVPLILISLSFEGNGGRGGGGVDEVLVLITPSTVWVVCPTSPLSLKRSTPKDVNRSKITVKGIVSKVILESLFLFSS